MEFLLTLGVMTFAGYAIGRALQKIASLIILILGVVFIGIALLMYYDILLGINWSGTHAATHASSNGLITLVTFLFTTALQNLSASLGLGLGFYIAFNH